NAIGASNKVLLSTGNGRYLSAENKQEEVIPEMTSNTRPSGKASSYNDSIDAYKAFKEEDYFQGGDKVTKGCVQYESNELLTAIKAEIDVEGHTNYSPSHMIIDNVNIYGSINGEDFQLLHTEIIGQQKRTGVIVIDFDRKYSFYCYRLEINATRKANNGYHKFRIHKFQLINDSNFVKSNNVSDFNNHGMSPQDLSEIDFSSEFTEKHYVQNEPIKLDSGRVFKQPLDINKITKNVKINNQSTGGN